jgi:hypothetical protein
VPDSFPGVVLCEQVDSADWIRAALAPWARGRLLHVSTLVPAQYPAHGRILHRARTASSNEHVRWSAIATSTGRPLHAGTRFNELVGWRVDARHQSPPAPWDQPNDGSLLPDECAAVADVLAAHTTTPEICWFCVWEGFGWAELHRMGARAPRVTLEHRNCLLFRGAVRAATAFRSGSAFQSPTLWWPDDRAWTVATEIDGYSTYVGTTAAALRALIDHPGLEVLECAAEQEIDPSPFPAQ